MITWDSFCQLAGTFIWNLCPQVLHILLAVILEHRFINLRFLPLALPQFCGPFDLSFGRRTKRAGTIFFPVDHADCSYGPHDLCLSNAFMLLSNVKQRVLIDDENLYNTDDADSLTM